MGSREERRWAWLALGAALAWPLPARAQAARSQWPIPDGAALVRLLGARATDAFTVRGGMSHGGVRIPRR